jgi:hypothetical protein
VEIRLLKYDEITAKQMAGWIFFIPPGTMVISAKSLKGLY